MKLRLLSLLFIVVCFFCFFVHCEGNEDAKGSVWPKPRRSVTFSKTYAVDVSSFSFSLSPSSAVCQHLTEGFIRYEKLIKSSSTASSYKLRFRPSNSLDVMTTLKVDMRGKCEEFPHQAMNEAYTLTIGNDENFLYSESVWGILRGLETFSQLLWTTPTGEVMINETSIVDAPRYSFRGIMIDTSRHFLPVNTILQVLTAMEYNKLNVLHWHIVDSSSFPYVSTIYPNLHLKGSYNPSTHVYTPQNIKTIIEFAKLRGIRVVPEFDTPGHTASWGPGQPGLLTPCYTDGKPNGEFGPINPINEDNYHFIDNLWSEIRNIFPDEYIHLGGDEVNFNCWKSNPEITEYMKQKNITGDYPKLEQEYIERVINISDHHQFSYIVWQEVIDNGVKAKKSTVVDLWKNRPSVQEELAKVTKLGYNVIISAPWYLNFIHYGQDWRNLYKFEPTDFSGSDEQKDLILGGEACIWGEYVDSTNIMSRLWPRASAVAERLWSDKEVNDVTEAFNRLHQHRCRLLRRGISAEPLFTGYCDVEWENVQN